MTDWEFIPDGDAEAAIVDILTNLTPELSASRVTVSTNLVGYSPELRWIEVVQTGGVHHWPIIYRPRIDIDVYAERRSVALDISNICVASVKRAMGSYDNFGFRLTDCRIESGPMRVPDPLQEVTRYVTSLRLTGRSSNFLPPPT
jgi:hypothetical protein